MSIFIRRFRDWWQPPRKASDRIEHRQVTFLELFYDLVYVVIIAELSHALAAHVGWKGLGNYAFLFVIVWWAWFNGTSYHDLHGNNDVRTRVFTFLQMLSVVAMAIFAHDALGETSIGFAWSYAAFQLILTFLWWRTGVYDENHRTLSAPYSASFLVTTLLFAGSTFVPTPWRFYMWALAIVISLLLPLYTFSLGKRNPIAQAEIEIVQEGSPSLVERFGLFNIIVLGEIVVGVVSGVTESHHLTWNLGIVAALGTLTAVGLWWVYFDTVSHRLPISTPLGVGSWLYLHLPLTMSIAAVGAAVLNVVEHTGEHLPSEVRWLLVGATSVVLICIALLLHTIQLTPVEQKIRPATGWVMLISGIVIALLGLTAFEILPLLVFLVILLLAPIFVGTRAWLLALEQEAEE
jgi:low temperature requirement protein LtrA